MFLRKLFLLMLPVLLVCSSAQARETIVVKTLTPRAGISKQVAAALSDVIKDSLSQHYDVQSLEDLSAIAGIKEEQLKTGCDDTQCLLDVAGALNADLVVAGSLSKLGSTYRFSLRLIQARGENAGVLKRASEKCKCTEDQLIEAAERVALKLVSKNPQVAAQPVVPPVALNPAKLYVDTEPAGAQVRILNIGPKFEQGIELEAGRYHVEVSAPEYATKRSWETLAEGETKRLTVGLSKVPTKTQAPVLKEKTKKPAKQLFQDQKGWVSINLPGGYTVSEQPHQDRTSAIISYGTEITILLSIVPGPVVWDAEAEMYASIVKMQESGTRQIQKYNTLKKSGCPGYVLHFLNEQNHQSVQTTLYELYCHNKSTRIEVTSLNWRTSASRELRQKIYTAIEESFTIDQ